MNLNPRRLGVVSREVRTLRSWVVTEGDPLYYHDRETLEPVSSVIDTPGCKGRLRVWELRFTDDLYRRCLRKSLRGKGITSVS